MLLARRLIAPKSGHTYPQVLGYYPKGEGGMTGRDAKRWPVSAGQSWEIFKSGYIVKAACSVSWGCLAKRRTRVQRTDETPGRSARMHHRGHVRGQDNAL